MTQQHPVPGQAGSVPAAGALDSALLTELLRRDVLRMRAIESLQAEVTRLAAEASALRREVEHFDVGHRSDPLDRLARTQDWGASRARRLTHEEAVSLGESVRIALAKRREFGHQ